MQSPLAALVGIASGAVDLIQRAISHDSPKAGFDEQLQSALAEAPGAGTPIKEKAKTEKGSTDDDIKALLENPQAVHVLQYLCALQSMGLNNADAKALLSGKTEISDDGLKAILAAVGIKGTDSAQLMADPKLVAGLKTQLADTVLTKNNSFTEMLDEAQSAQSSEVEASTGAIPEVLQAVDVLEKTLNIPKKTLQDLFFSSDPQVRQGALDDATTQINEFLKANAGKDLPKQVTGALGVLKGALTEDEFAKIENTFKAVNQDPALIAQGLNFDEHVVQSLAKTLGNESGTTQGSYTQQVIDQIKQALPTGMKTLEGSMTLKLNPPMLGRVDVEIRLQDGQIMASFKADQPITRDILQQNMHILKDTLAEQGIKATQFVVTTDTFNSRDHQGNPLAWAGYEPDQNGSSGRQGNRQGTGNPGRGQDEYLGGNTPVQGYSEQGGLDIFA